MDLHFRDCGTTHLRLFVNDTLVGELSVGQLDTRDTLAQQVTQAHCLTALPPLLASLATEAARASDIPDHTLTKPEQRQAAYLRGLVAGLQGQTIQHPLPGVPPIPPDPGHCYSEGYLQGWGLHGVIQTWKQAVAEEGA